MRPIVIASVGLLLAACTQGGGSASDSSSTTEAAPLELEAQLDGHLVFSAEGDVWTMRADGSERTRLTDDPAEDLDPAWSPDGTMIAFRSHRDGNEEVYVMDADGSDERNLSRSPLSDYSPAWSPDGTRIAFASDRDGDPNEIYVMDADGSSQVRVTDNPGIDEYPAWSPDGERIAFESNRLGWPSLPSATPPGYDGETFGDEEVWIMRPDGSGERNLTRNPMEDDAFPAWSPDGSWLISTRYGALHVVSPSGDRTSPVANSPGTDFFPDWIE